MEQNRIIEGICQAVIEGNKEAAVQWANRAVQAKIDALLALQQGAEKGLGVVGDSFHRQEVFIPELIMSAEAAKAASAILNPEIEKASGQAQRLGVMVLGTVAGDIHDIGKTLVGTLCRAAGFSVIDLGISVPTEKFVDAVKQYRPDILGLSALITNTIRQQRVVIEALKAADLRSRIKVMVGGGAVTQAWADEIGADAYGEDAADAAKKAKEIMSRP